MFRSPCIFTLIFATANHYWVSPPKTNDIQKKKYLVETNHDPSGCIWLQDVATSQGFQMRYHLQWHTKLLESINQKQLSNPIYHLQKKKHIFSAIQLQQLYFLCNLFESFMSGQKNRVGIYRSRYRLELLTKHWRQTRRAGKAFRQKDN